MEILLSPPIAFLIYVPLVLLILIFGKIMAPAADQSEAKTSIYGSGELAPTNIAAPGYRPFVVVAFFFAILHLGMLIIGTGSLTPISAVYILGLMLTLIALILG